MECKDQFIVFTIGKSHFGHSACNEEAPLLFLGAYCCSPDPTPFTIITSEIRLHGKNYQMGDDFRSI